MNAAPTPLDLSDESRLEAFERAFYRAFRPLTHNRLIHTLWCWDHDQQRLRTRIPYAQQLIVANLDDQGAIGSACAVNIANGPMQSATFGFEPTELGAGECEFLALFTLDQPGIARRQLQSVLAMLATRGFHHAYFTTGPRVLAYYQRLGAEQLCQRCIDGEERFFLRFTMPQQAG